MSLTTSDQPRTPQSSDEQAYLSAFLARKLRNVPRNHVPSLQVSDILNQTPRALHLPNIPLDLQLSFFLRNRAQIDCYNGKPLKNSEIQSLDVTRAIWYYRLDATHQFQRYHDTVRWNIAMFAALLTDGDMAGRRSDSTNASTYTNGTSVSTHRRKDTYHPLPPAARRFMTSYLVAVLEHHNSPQSFVHREAFLKLWKEGAWDLFSNFSSAMKKLMKNEMKALMKEWERELVYAMRHITRREYGAHVGKFVGSLVPGERDEVAGGLRANVMLTARLDKGNGESGKVGGQEVRNELLEALHVPLGEQSEDVVKEEEGVMVADLRYAIGVVRKVRPRDILPVLMRLFPPEDRD